MRGGLWPPLPLRPRNRLTHATIPDPYWAGSRVGTTVALWDMRRRRAVARGLASRNFRAHAFLEGSKESSTGRCPTQSTRKLLSPPALRLGVRRERARLFSGAALVGSRQLLCVQPAEKLPRLEAGQAPHVLHGDELEAGPPMPGHARKGYGTANQATEKGPVLERGLPSSYLLVRD